MTKTFCKHHSRKALSLLLALCMLLSCLGFTGLTASAVQSQEEPASAGNGLAQHTQDGVILHCWNWSYENIKNYMPQIAAAGYSTIQTSPVTQPKDYEWKGAVASNVGTPNGTGGNDGQWWKMYQPVTMSICDNGQTWLGNKADFTAMCKEADKYGVKVIVDIVANHMGNITGWKNSLDDVSPQIGEFWKPDMLTDPTYWHINDLQIWMSDGRRDVTQGSMGMPDLNTKDKRVQNMVLDLLKECVDCGADGFRFDAAKHIEMPDDDPAFASDFWPTVLNGVKAYAGRELYFYGEILNRVGDGLGIDSYTKYMSVTDNATGDNKRNDIRYANAGSAANSSMSYAPNKTVLWAESHDTYMGGGSSYLANDTMIKQTWAMVGSRKDATALYFARPYYSDQILDENGNKKDTTNLKQTMMGEVGTTTWCDPSVSAVNNFHNYFIGQGESLSSNNSNICYNERGTSGVVIAKLDGPGAVDIQANKMKNGTYTDQVSGNTFTVSGGRIKGTIASSDGIAVVYNAVSTPSNTVSQKGGSFTGDTLSVTLGLKDAVSGTYQIDGGKVTTYTSSTTVTLGKSIPAGSQTKLSLTATDGKSTTSISYTFTKEDPEKPTDPPTEPDVPGTDPPAGLTVFFDNSAANWDQVYCYVYTDGGSKNNGAWPGQAMTKWKNNIYYYTVPAGLENSYVLFNNNQGSQIPSANEPGFALAGASMIYQDAKWSAYTPEEPTVTYILGDANGDGSVSLTDVLQLQKIIASMTAVPAGVRFAAADTDGNGKIDLQDVLNIQKHLANFDTGDVKIGSVCTYSSH